MDNIYGDSSVKEVVYKDHRITIFTDDSPCESPRDWDNLGTMLCLHSRYNLGDKHDLDREAIMRIVSGNDVVVLPLYLYDHSGLTMQTTPFECPWDSGLVGYIYVSKAAIRSEFGFKRMSAKRVAKVQDALRTEVKLYDFLLTGQVYGYEVTNSNGDTVDSCWGFFTDDLDYIIQQGKDTIDCE